MSPRSEAEISEQNAHEAYSTGRWGCNYRGDPAYLPNYLAGKAQFEAKGAPDLFQTETPEWER